MKYKNIEYKYDPQGNQYWYNESGDYHRDNGLPAIEFVSGTKRWYLNGVCCRFDEWTTDYFYEI